jgi:hypothetical protein
VRNRRPTRKIRKEISKRQVRFALSFWAIAKINTNNPRKIMLRFMPIGPK